MSGQKLYELPQIRLGRKREIGRDFISWLDGASEQLAADKRMRSACLCEDIMFRVFDKEKSFKNATQAIDVYRITEV